MLRPGRRLAVDVGKARIGVAITDFHGILATPLTTIKREVEIKDSIQHLLDAALAVGDILEIYVGVPVNLKGAITESTIDAITFSETLEAITDIPVLLVDERMTTSLANSQLREVGKSQKSARSTIDQMAAVAILEYALSTEKNTSLKPGLSISQWKAKHE